MEKTHREESTTCSTTAGPTGYLKHYGDGKQGNGWYSFDHGGVHVIGLVNVVDFKPKGLETAEPWAVKQTPG